MDQFLQIIGQFLFDQGYIPIRFFGAFSLGLIGFMLYSNIKEPSDQWDKFLKELGVLLLVMAGILVFLVAINLV
jgi:hypothetical protein